MACMYKGIGVTREVPRGGWGVCPANRCLARDGTGPGGVAERAVVVRRPGNAGGAKGLGLRRACEVASGPGDWR
jgi:hypothetical protein